MYYQYQIVAENTFSFFTLAEMAEHVSIETCRVKTMFLRGDLAWQHLDRNLLL